MKAKLIISLGALLSAALFFWSYRIFDDVAVASTGYNATEKGLFGWEYSYAEHDFVEEGKGYTPVLVDSGEIIRPAAFVIEVVFFCLVGFGLAFVSVSLFVDGGPPLEEQEPDSA